MDTFVETYNFDGITVIPFCTSGSSGIGMSGKNLEANAGSGTWLDGKRFSGNVSEGEIASWISSLPIVKQRDLADADITVMDAKYTGSALEPAVEVVLDGDLLAQGTDYTVFYSDNVNAGKGSVKITGTGDYTGSANAEFTISPASISGAAISGVKSAHAVEEIFVPLLKKLTELQKKGEKEDQLRKRLIDRRIKTGVEEKASAEFVDFSDMPNVRLCLEHSKKADLILELDRDGDYHVTEEAM